MTNAQYLIPNTQCLSDMKINNAEALALLFTHTPKIASCLLRTTPYIKFSGDRAILVVRCRSFADMKYLVSQSCLVIGKLHPFIGYEIHLECSQRDRDHDMVAVTERTIENAVTSEPKFLSLETLSGAINKPIKEVKAMLGQSGQVIHLTPSGEDIITESAFDTIVLNWAKSFKEGMPQSEPETTTSNTKLAKQEVKERKPNIKVLTSELTIEDIAVVKTGKNAGSPSLTNKGIQQTLESFFNKVKMDDTTKIDAISAFVESTSEFGQMARKKLLAAYKKFTKGGNQQEIESRLVEGAKIYLESLVASEVESDESEEEE